jgi:hypothetical protein
LEADPENISVTQGTLLEIETNIFLQGTLPKQNNN